MSSNWLKQRKWVLNCFLLFNFFSIIKLLAYYYSGCHQKRWRTMRGCIKIIYKNNKNIICSIESCNLTRIFWHFFYHMSCGTRETLKNVDKNSVLFYVPTPLFLGTDRIRKRKPVSVFVSVSVLCDNNPLVFVNFSHSVKLKKKLKKTIN